MEQVVGRIEFGNTREGVALATLQEALVDKAMWMSEAMRKDEIIEELKAEIRRLSDGSEVERELGDGILPKRRLRKQKKLR